jgi:signal transduction histidine kinase
LTELAQSYEKNNVLNQQVNHMQKLESIGRLTSGIAHDFNNILCCMLGFNEMTQYASEDIQDKALRDEIENNVKQVDLAGNRAKELINKMLTYCRQDTQKKQMEIKPTKLVIQEVLEMLKPALTSRIEIKMQLECDEIIQIDAIDLHQILTNLAVNARDAMKERGSFISISLKKITNVSAYCLACASAIHGDFVELSVTDNGSGIEPEIVSRIFDPFFTTKAQGEGTGLGLSTVSGIVHQSLGHILIDSNSEKETHGTSFRMLFPR